MSNVVPGYAKIVAMLLAALLAGGCAGVKSPENGPPSVPLDSLLAEAAATQKAGQTDKALQLYRAAAEKYPADKTPWLRMAQTKFDAANFGEATSLAIEALRRDPTNEVANSIVAVSGLRLAVKALADLRKQNGLNGSVKAEAQDLATLLRQNLGESVLLAPPVAASAPSESSDAVAKKPPTRRAPPPRKKPDPVASSSGSGAGASNPFGGLK